MWKLAGGLKVEIRQQETRISSLRPPASVGANVRTMTNYFRSMSRKVELMFLT